MVTDGEWAKTREVLSVLREHLDVPIESEFLEACSKYWQLSSTWNLSAKLMSKVDLEERFDDHVADSLTLLPYVRAAALALDCHAYVDIGSGGGFPAIPLLLTRPCALTSVELLERSERKSEFLRQATRELGLGSTTVRSVAYPSGVPPRCDASVITARATENPSGMDRAITTRLGSADLYISQRPQALTGGALAAWRIQDVFSTRGMRRSVLEIVARPQSLEKFHVEPILRPFQV